MKQTKRPLSALLILCLLLGLMPTAARAVSAHSHPICGASCSHTEGHGEVSYTALTADMINTGETTNYTLAAGNYYLAEDITTARNISASGEVNLCLNGYTITCTESAYMPVSSGKPFRICDCQGGGGITDNRTGSSANSRFMYIGYKSDVTLFGGTFTGKSVLYMDTSGVLTVDGATIKASSTALEAQNTATVYIKSGELSTSDSFYTVIVFSPNFTMTGGKVVNTDSYGAAVLFSSGGGGTISGGTIQAKGSRGVGVGVEGKNNVFLSGAPVIEGKVADIQFSAVTSATGLLTVAEDLEGKFRVLRENWDASYENFRITETKPFPFTTAADRDDSDHFTVTDSRLALRDVEDKATGKHTLELYRKHAWATGWQNNETHHWHNCSNDDCTLTDNAQKEGYATHTAVVDPAVPATCVDAGMTAGSHCSKCKYVIIPQETIPATGEHTYPGYEKNETQHWQKCSVCRTETSKTAHKAVTDKEVPPTCTSDGKTAGSHCSVCGYVITPQQSIPASHTWGKWTLQADGKTVTRVCEVDVSHTESKTLAITLDESSYVYSGGENKPTVTVKVGGATLTPGTDYTVSYKDNVNKGTATVTVTGKGSYAGSANTTFAVTARPLTATAATATDRVYDGTAAVTVTDVTLNGVVAGDDVAVNTTGLKGTVSSPDVRDTPYEEVTLNGLTLTGAKAGNYTVQVNVTLPTSVTISKAAPPTATAVSRNITNKLAKEYTFALATLLPQLNEEGITANRKDWGAPVYTIQNVDLPDGYYDGENAPARIEREDGMAILHLPIRFNDVETTGEVGSITVEIQSNNYETFSNILKINANNKTSVRFEGISITDRSYNGQPIAYDGTLAVKTEDGTNVTANIPADHIEITYKGVDGTAYGGDRSEIPPTNAGSFAMVVRMADEDENYIGVRQFHFVISKAPGRGSVTMADFTCGGEPSVPVPTSDTNGVEGVSYVYKVRGAADKTYSTTKPVAPGEYTVQASFPAATNYEAVTATADFTVSHAWASTWSTDAAGHWRACTNCGEKKDAAEHVYGSDQEVICADCGYDRTVIGDQTKGEVELKPGTDTPEVTTDTEALKELGGEIHGWQTVTVKLTVEKQDEPAAKDEIAELVTGKKDDVLYLDLSLLRQVNTEAPEAITDTGSKVLEIAVTYDFTGKKDVTVYRKHGNTPAAALTGLTERPDGTFSDGTFYTDTVNGKVYIYASKFSTYAIGYTARTGSSGIYYTLTATAGQGGSISPSGKVSFRRNETKNFAIIPDEGYRVADVLVDGKSVGPVMEYTFERIAADHTIEAVFRKTTSGAAGCARDSTCPISKFPDTETEAWYHDGVHYCIENGLMSGYGENRFGPNDTLTRGMLVQILYNEAGQPAVTGNSLFDDVAADAWYADAVTWAAKEGIVEGYGNGSFGPEDAITREQLAAMLHRHAQAKGSDVSVGENTNILSYKDFDRISEWAIPALQWAVGSGIVTGKDGSILDPASQATRAEAAVMLQRFLGREK